MVHSENVPHPVIMPWYFPWSDSIKKRACRYILQHYVGHFFKEKLSLDQLSLDVYEGKGQIKDVQLDIQAVNDALKVRKFLELILPVVLSSVYLLQNVAVYDSYANCHIVFLRPQNLLWSWWMVLSVTSPSLFHGVPSWKATSRWR